MDELRELLERTYFGNTLLQYLYFFGTLAAAVILGKLVHFLFRHQIQRAAERTETELDDDLVGGAREPFVLALFGAALHFGKAFLTLAPEADKALRAGSLVIVTFAVTWLVLRVIDIFTRRYLEPRVQGTDSKLDDQLLPILRKLVKGIVALLATIVVLSNMGYDILSVLAGLGIGGLAIALAAQDALKNVIAGITLFWDKPFQLEDWVAVAGHSGEVVEIGLRSTRLKTEQGTVVTIPNSTVADSSIENFSSRVARRRSFVLGLPFHSSADEVDTAIETLYQALRDQEGTDSDNILVRFVRFGEYSLEIEVVYWITDLGNWMQRVHETHMGIKRRLDAAGVRLALPTASRHLIQQ